MSRCTLAIAANAASTATSATGVGASARLISTKVPSSGRARRRLADAGAIGGNDPLHAFGHMRARQRRAGNIPDVAAHSKGAAAGLPDELREPARGATFAT